ncbi:MAG: branched-chain amino acid aminotransferase, partial [Flavobacteriales bacterium]
GFGRVFSDHMLVAIYKDGAWDSPRITPYGAIPFSPAISALHYGQAIFEGLKAFKNDQDEVFIFRPNRNAQRLNVSARRMCMAELPEEIFLAGLKTLVKIDSAWIPKGEGESLYIRPHMFAIDEYVGVKPSDSYMFVIFTCPVGKYYTTELKVKIETEFTRAVRGGTGHAKAAGNYGASLFPTQIAKDAGYDQVLWTDGQTHEYFEESGTMNVMFLSGNRILTPATSDSILDGITRSSVLQLMRDWNYQVEERKVSVAEIVDLMKAGDLHGAFGIGTAATIAPICTIQHEGTNYELDSANYMPFSDKINTYMDHLKRGMEVDVHHWNVRV